MKKEAGLHFYLKTALLGTSFYVPSLCIAYVLLTDKNEYSYLLGNILLYTTPWFFLGVIIFLIFVGTRILSLPKRILLNIICTEMVFLLFYLASTFESDLLKTQTLLVGACVSIATWISLTLLQFVKR